MEETDPAIGPPPIPSAHKPTPHQLYTEITQRAEQASFMLLLQEEINYRRALGITTHHNFEKPTEEINYSLRSKVTGAPTAPTSPFSTGLSPKSLPLPVTIERKSEAESASLPPSVILSGLTMIERGWLVNIRLQAGWAETNWETVALLFEERFKKMITPSIAKATSDFLFHVGTL